MFKARKTALLAVILLAVLSILFLSGCNSNRAVAVVNGERITKGRLETYKKILILTNPGLEEVLKEGERKASLEKELTENLIQIELFKQSAADLGLVVSAEEAEEAYRQAREYIEGVMGSAEEFEKKINEMKLTEEQFKQLITDSLYGEKIVEYFTEQVTDEEIRAFLDENPDILKISEQIDVSHILVDSEEEALAARERIQAGESFGDVAVDVSKDTFANEQLGRLGYIAVDDTRYDRDFMEAAKALEVGELSEPVETQFGWHLILLHERQPESEYSFEEVRGFIAQNLAVEKVQEHMYSLEEEGDIKRLL